MPKLSDIKKKSKANNSLKTDVRIGLIDDSISEIFTIDIEKQNLIKDKFHKEAKDHDTSKKQQINTTSKTADKLNIKKESFTSTSTPLKTKDRTKDNLDRQLSTKKASFNSNNQNESTDKTTDSLISASNHNSPIDIKKTELNNLSTSQHKNLEQVPTLITKKTKDNTTDKEINLSHKTNHKQPLNTNKTTDITKDSLTTLSYHNSKIKPDDCKAKLNTSSNFQHESHQQSQKLHPQETTDIYTDKTTDVRTTPFQETQQEKPFPITKTKDISADITKDILKKHLPNETNENSEASAKTNITSRDSNHNSQMVTENLISPSNIADQTINFNGMPDSHHEELNDLNKAQTKETTDISTDKTADKTSHFSKNNTLIVENPYSKTTDISTDTSKDIPANANLYQGQTTDVKTRTTDKLETHPRTPQRTELRTRLNYQNIPERSYSELSKLQQKIIKTLYISCVQSSGTITQKITINYLIDQTQSSAESIKRTIRRLMRENFLDKYEWKDGRGGWTKYELHPYFYKSLFGIVGIKTEDMSADITTDKPGTHPRTTPPSSSISFNNINKELTTNEYPFNPADVPGQQQLGPEFDSDWQNIDITPLASIGFGNNHLSQLFTKNELTPKQVQESINAFAFDLEENKRGEKIKTSPLNLFMGILKGGSPYNPPKNYESDEDRVLREQVEAEREKLEKRQQLQSELKELKYQNWLLDLSIEKKLDILDVPQAFFEKMPIEAIESGLKKHFEMKVL